MTNKTQKWDSIDSELARAYFNPIERRQDHGTLEPKKLHHFFSPRRTAAIITALIAAALAFLLAVKIMTGLKTSSLSSSKNSSKKYFSDVNSTPPPSLYGVKILYDFETSKDGWEIPAWAFDKEDHRQRSMMISSDISSNGQKSLRVDSDFIPGVWVASLAEIQHYLDLSDYEAIAVDIYLPSDAPKRGFRAKLILTVGEDWRFVEMSRSVRLEPGKWTYILASLRSDSKDWKWTKVDNEFKNDVRKISLRVEYEGNLAYSGPVYIDNFRVGNLKPLEDQKSGSSN